LAQKGRNAQHATQGSVPTEADDVYQATRRTTA